MTRKQLEELGYNEEQVNQLVNLHGKGIEKFKGELEETTTKLTQAQEELVKRNEDFKQLQEGANASNELQEKFNELNTQYEQYQDEAKKREQDIKLNSAINLVIAKSGTVDDVSLKANLNLSEVELQEDGTLKGITEQLETLKESKSFLFGEKLNGGLEHGKAVPKEVTLKDTLFGGKK